MTSRSMPWYMNVGRPGFEQTGWRCELNPEIFREYDIRGRADRDLTPDVVEGIGKAFGTIIRNQGLDTVTCGRDGRTHSETIQAYLIRGMTSTGLGVINIGQCPTPVLYFSIFHLNTHGGIQVTGSHNPPEFNGFKMCLGTSTIFGEKIQEVRRIIKRRKFVSGNGAEKKYEIFNDYLKYLSQNINIAKPLKIVVDAGNGVAGLVAPKAFEEQGCQVIPLFCDVDGTFPNHHPDPTIPDNLNALVRVVKETGADAGMAYDGDGDRLGVVDEKGQIIYGDKLLILFARDLLREHPGAAVIGEVKCSRTLYDDISKRGGRPIMWKTGHSLIKQKMKEEKALLAGEMSGHIFFADRYFGFDDGLYASLRLGEILSRSNGRLSSMLEDVPLTYSTPEIRIECPDRDKFKIVERARQWFNGHYECIDVDGVRVIVDGGWGLIRASNTQPVLVLRFESDTPEGLEDIRRLVEDKIKEIKGELVDGKG